MVKPEIGKNIEPDGQEIESDRTVLIRDREK